MEPDRQCAICLFDSYESVAEQCAFFEAVLEELSRDPNGPVVVCKDCYSEVARFLALESQAGQTRSIR